MARSADGDEVERTPDGRFIVVGGRRWRASDPSIPDALRQEPCFTEGRLAMVEVRQQVRGVLARIDRA